MMYLYWSISFLKIKAIRWVSVKENDVELAWESSLKGHKLFLQDLNLLLYVKVFSFQSW